MSFNIKGFKERNFDYVRELYNKYDFLMLQETWLYKFEENIVSKVLPGSNYCSTSAMEDDNIDRLGKPYGSCMIIWKRTLASLVSQVNTLTPRVCAVTLTTKHNNLLFLSIYMPVNDNSKKSIEEAIKVLTEISRLSLEYKGYKIVMGGDFNIDFLRKPITKITEIFIEFLMEESFLSNDDIFDNISFTFQSNNGLRSTIDHFIFTENFIDYIKGFKTLYDGNNLSDHFPIVLNISLDNLLKYKNDKYFKQYDNVFNWKSANENDITNYRAILDELLSLINIPEGVLNCHN